MNTSNIYTILFRDILPSWKGWPKREVICSSSNSNREMWERSYRVFFRDNTLIGVCPSYDIWDSFEHIGGMDVFNDDIERSYKKITGKELDISKNGIIKGMKELDKEMDKEKDYEDYSFPIELIKGESIIDTLNKSLDPKKNGFKQVKVGSNLPVGNEVWSDKDCVLVSGGEVEEFLNEI